MSLSERDFEFVRKFLFEHARIALQPDQRHMVESRLQPLLRKGRWGRELRELIDHLRDHPMGELRAQVIDALTTNETSFFRDIHPFQTLKSAVLPELIAKRKRQRALRFWSAGCSTGQEPLSLAMLVRQDFPELEHWDVRITATELSSTALAKAQSGRYNTLEVSRGLPARMLQRFFERDGSEYRVQSELLSMIEWSQLNLAKPFPRLPPFDVVFLRNVLIYFPLPVQEDVLNKVHKVMRNDGCLFLGTVESPLGLQVAFESAVYGKTTLYRPSEPS